LRRRSPRCFSETRFATVGLWRSLCRCWDRCVRTYHHYILVSPDNVAHLPEGAAEAHARFISSAGISALLELASALVGASCWPTPNGVMTQ